MIGQAPRKADLPPQAEECGIWFLSLRQPPRSLSFIIDNTGAALYTPAFRRRRDRRADMKAIVFAATAALALMLAPPARAANIVIAFHADDQRRLAAICEAAGAW